PSYQSRVQAERRPIDGLRQLSPLLLCRREGGAGRCQALGVGSGVGGSLRLQRRHRRRRLAAAPFRRLGRFHADQLVLLGGGNPGSDVVELVLQGQQVLGVANAASIQLPVDDRGALAQHGGLVVGRGDGLVGTAALGLSRGSVDAGAFQSRV